MHGASPTAKAEWRAGWHLPLLGCLGYSITVVHIYAIGPFMAPLQEAFGWSRAEVSVGLTIANVGGALATVLVGALVDRFGPRRIALIGVPLLGLAVSALGAADGSMTNWIGLWVVISACAIFTQPTVWSSAAVGRFEASRGLALAVILCGGSLTAAVMPLLSTWLISAVGWRAAFPGIALIWVGILFPLIFLFFRNDGAGRKQADTAAAAQRASLPGFSLSQALRRSSFYKLTFAGGFFAFGIVGIVVHFVPILADVGVAPMTAASAAGLIGVCAIVGRLGAGALLDRFPGHRVGFLAFLLPVPACLLLLFGGSGAPQIFTAAVFLGLTLGAELDLICYLATRHFGLRCFGVILGGLFTCVGFGTAFGPLGAGWSYDVTGGYDGFIGLTGVLMTIGALAMLSLGRGPSSEEMPRGA